MVARRLVGMLAVAIPAFVAGVLVLPHSPAGLRDMIASVGPLAPVFALAVWIVLVPALFPAPVLAAAGGLAFGVVGGCLLTVAGAAAGGLMAFALGRFAARGAVECFGRRASVARLSALLERRGLAAVLAARLMPGVPAGALHYLAGASPVRARSFAAAITIGAVARTAPYALLGQGLVSGSVLSLIVAAASIALGGLAAAVLLRRLRRDAVATA